MTCSLSNEQSAMLSKPRVERAQKDLEIQTEAARLSAEFALKAKMIKVI